MTRKELLSSKEYHVLEIQNTLYNTIENYRKEKGITKTQLAAELGFNKSYITQVLNGDFDHKVSKLVELSLAAGKVPILSFVDLDEFVENDEKPAKGLLIEDLIPPMVDANALVQTFLEEKN